MRCFLCKKSDFEKVYSLKTKDILRCKNDGLFVARNVRDHSPQYGREYFSNAPNLFNQSYFQKKLKTIKLVTKHQKPKILDVGCGWGDFEEVLEKQKVSYLGIDINKESIEICRKKGLNCKLSTIENLVKFRTYNNNDSGVVANAPPQNDVILASPAKGGTRPESALKFNVITLFQVIEHQKNPLSLLNSAKKLLKPNGFILITTPNNDSPLRKILRTHWSVYDEPSHYVFYNKKSLKRTLSLAGFKNIKTKIDQLRFLSLSYILNRLKVPISNVLPLISNIPIPTDPLGDLEGIAFN